ncbi:MAG: hypothetical protein N2487_04680 [Verrucomicrobiae bacterium]|nr:hypothetical protein [Verrucomicrobiae bacterium]
MARNRRKDSYAWLKFGMCAALGVLLFSLIGVGFVREKGDIYNLSQEIRKRELRLQELREQNIRLQNQLATLRSPVILQSRAQTLNLGLIQIHTNTIVKFREDTNLGIFNPGFLPPGLESNVNSIYQKPLVISHR